MSTPSAPSAGLPHERRLTEQLVLYWNTLRGHRKYPAVQDIKPEDIQDVWPDCFLVGLRETTEHPEHTYAYIGDNITAMFGGKLATASVLPLADNLASQYYLVMRAQKPLVQETQFTNLEDAEVKYRQILLPLGPDEFTVDYILGGLRSNITYGRQG
jgi:hypothetical protein